MKTNRLPRILAGFLVLLWLGACTVTGPERVELGLPTDQEAAEMTDEELVAAHAAADPRIERVNFNRAKRLMAGEVVDIGDPRSYVRTLRNPLTGEVYAWSENDFYGIDGPGATTVTVQATNDGGKIVRGPGGQPLPVIANVVTEADAARFYSQLTGNILAGAANGTGAALINRTVNRNGCESGCAPDVVNLVEGANAAAQALSRNDNYSETDLRADVDVRGAPPGMRPKNH